MFNFKREGTKVIVDIEAKANVPKRWFPFSWECSSEVYADLLLRSFTKNLTNKLEEIRREAYEQGWADAKAKRKRESWFSGWF